MIDDKIKQCEKDIEALQKNLAELKQRQENIQFPFGSRVFFDTDSGILVRSGYCPDKFIIMKENSFESYDCVNYEFKWRYVYVGGEKRPVSLDDLKKFQHPIYKVVHPNGTVLWEK